MVNQSQSSDYEVVRIRHTTAFGKDFSHLDDEHLQDLQSLEREGAIYADHWIDELKDFRHVRIQFSQREIDEYVRSLWALELFLQAGSPEWAKTVKGIPDDIAKRADSYQAKTRDGEVFGPPYHCPAAFMGPEIEALVCSNKRAVVLEEAGRTGLLHTLRRAIDAITPAIRRFQAREKGLASWKIGQEDDVRDLLYVMLRAAISDIKTEEPIPSRAGAYKFVDIYSALAGLLVEIKWIYEKHSWKRILREINDDIQSYARHPNCKTLVFLVVDAAKGIGDPVQFEREISEKQIIDGRDLEVLAYVREP